MALPTPTAATFYLASFSLPFLWFLPPCARWALLIPWEMKLVLESAEGTGTAEHWDVGCWQHLGVLRCSPERRWHLGRAMCRGAPGIQIHSGSIKPGILQLSHYPMPKLLVRKK